MKLDLYVTQLLDVSLVTGKRIHVELQTKRSAHIAVTMAFVIPAEFFADWPIGKKITIEARLDAARILATGS